MQGFPNIVCSFSQKSSHWKDAIDLYVKTILLLVSGSKSDFFITRIPGNGISSTIHRPFRTQQSKCMFCSSSSMKKNSSTDNNAANFLTTNAPSKLVSSFAAILLKSMRRQSIIEFAYWIVKQAKQNDQTWLSLLPMKRPSSLEQLPWNNNNL